MTELELYKFSKEKEIDWRGDDKLYLWIPFHYLDEFTELLGSDYLCEGDKEVSLQLDCVCVNLFDICENFEIEPTNILPKE